MDEFVQMLGDANLLNEFFGNRECGPLWNISMMTNRDELGNERHLNMTFVEFCEAIARVADKFDMANMEDFFPDYKAKHETQLDKKLESTFLQIIKNCLDPRHFAAMHSRYSKIVETEIENAKLGLITQFAKES